MQRELSEVTRSVDNGGAELNDRLATAYSGMVDWWHAIALRDWFVPSILTLVVLAAYLPALFGGHLLDEQFAVAWTRAAGSSEAPLTDFFGWRGLAGADLWGFLTPLLLKIGSVVSFGITFLMRAYAIALHVLAAWLLYLGLRRCTAEVEISLVAAILFALFPLNAHAVSWIPGHGSLFAGVFVAAAIYTYLRGREDWRWMLVSLVMFMSALFCSASVWPVCLLIAMLECYMTYIRKVSSANPTLSICGPLLFLLLTAAYMAASGLLWQMTTWDARPVFTFDAFFKTIKALLFPVNQAIWPHYAKQFRSLYFLFVPYLLIAAISFKFDRRLGGMLLLSALWMVLCMVPVLGHISVSSNMFGAHLLYLAAMPLCVILAILMTASLRVLPVLVPGRKTPSADLLRLALAVLGVGLLAAFYFSHNLKQNGAFASGASHLRRLHKSMRVVQAKTSGPYILGRDLPENIASAPAFRSKSLLVLDSIHGLLSASTVSPGRLKDSLKDGAFRDAVFRWEPALNSLVPVDFTEPAAPFPAALSASELLQRLSPPIEHYPMARFDPAVGIILESNSMAGPSFKINADGLSNLVGDFIYVDAKIEAPNLGNEQLIELYWTTPQYPDYDGNPVKERRGYTKAIVGDGRFHRYYLSLRTIGWTTAGRPLYVTVGFPSGAKVTVQGMGVADKTPLCPTFNVLPEQGARVARFFSPYYNFPVSEGLGLYVQSCGATGITCTHNCDLVPNAEGVQVEISMPNKVYPNPNGNAPSGVGGKTLALMGKRGTYNIKIDDFPGPGVYSLRAISMDIGHNPIGQYSDAVYCLIQKRQKNGWSTE